jgi:hypothetical protein
VYRHTRGTRAHMGVQTLRHRDCHTLKGILSYQLVNTFRSLSQLITMRTWQGRPQRSNTSTSPSHAPPHIHPTDHILTPRRHCSLCHLVPFLSSAYHYPSFLPTGTPSSAGLHSQSTRPAVIAPCLTCRPLPSKSMRCPSRRHPTRRLLYLHCQLQPPKRSTN